MITTCEHTMKDKIKDTVMLSGSELKLHNLVHSETIEMINIGPFQLVN